MDIAELRRALRLSDACRADAERECEQLRGLVREVYNSARGDIRRDPGPSEILAETRWYERAAAVLGIER